MTPPIFQSRRLKTPPCFVRKANAPPPFAAAVSLHLLFAPFETGANAPPTKFLGLN